jgi:N-acetyl-gamma-glutamyl-phosphate reductase
MLRAAIVGATGYTGLELVRLLSRHPGVEIAALTSESSAGQRYAGLFPQFGGIVEHELVPRAALADAEYDAVFLALPHKASMEFVCSHDLESAPVIDLSADFRLKSAAIYADWYGVSHACPELLPDAVYGLPELHRERIRSARLVANPGCYPTCAILPLAPLLEAGLVNRTGIIVDAKSGVTGAGYKPKATTHYPTVNEGFMAYGLKRHRHVPEIEEQLGRSAGGELTLQFTPHLLPVNRGILSTIYAGAVEGTTEAELRGVLERAYGGEPFVRLVDEPPALDNVRGTNFCDIFVTVDERTENVLLISVIDNLVKGAAGQAVQNLNIMFELEETTGLGALALSP